MTYKRFALQDSAENTLGVLVGDYLDHQGLVGTTYQEQEVHSVVDATPPGAETDALAQEVRSKRNKMLADCDWTQLPDAPVDKEAWATYRQALRDITEQDGFPEDVEWPTRP
jgi:hypothetical protein